MTDYEDFDDRRIKHMEMIQAVVSRLGNDSFLIKGWTVTVAAAFLGFAVDQDKWQLAVASVGPTSLFWLLDIPEERATLPQPVRSGEDGWRS
jgi:hypothetical protein